MANIPEFPTGGRPNKYMKICAGRHQFLRQMRAYEPIRAGDEYRTFSETSVQIHQHRYGIALRLCIIRLGSRQKRDSQVDVQNWRANRDSRTTDSHYAT